MSSLITVPKVLLVRDEMAYEQKVPKIIWQTMKTNQVPVFMYDYTATWIRLNPEYEYRFYSDDDVIEFLKNDFPDYLEVYSKIKYGASKADLWRYLVMYKYGGVYADIDCRCLRPLREWINPVSAYVSQLGINKDLCQWLLISVPQNPIFLKAAQRALQNLIQNNSNAEYHGFEFPEGKLVIRENEPLYKFDDKVLGLAGPPVLQEAAEACFKDGSIADILSTIQIVCVSGAESCQMKGNVTHDSGHTSYRKALRILKTPYYGRLISRIKRIF
jgi:Glycosyltransferase sugar-binding region containing DXD motif